MREIMRELMVAEEVVDHPTKVKRAMLELGVPDNIKGHRYLAYSLELVINDPEYIEQVTSILYPKIAEKFNTTPSRVERAIRHAIENTWDRILPETCDKYFGGTISPFKGKPTNSEFIARMANALR